ncbi:MDR family MFS transporter [Streptomyces eurocidicus]|nr:MDR family MFS transporter [Streptomyces eurocidicus]MBB5123226.1 EmrB/QacA subfamily drug resistance transporter [Streptomyces eurocidicus]
MFPLMLALFLSNLDQTIVAAALPSIGADLRASADISWIVTAYLLTSAVTALVFGKLGDLHGRKKILQFSIVVFLAGSLLSGTANSAPLLALFRALQGIGGGGITSLVLAITGDLASPRQRARHQALLGMTAALALVTGPLLGGAFSEGLSWRWIFYVNLPIGITAFAMVTANLHLPRPAHDSGPVDVPGALVATLFTASVMLFMTWGGHAYAWSSGVVLGLIAFSIVSVPLYVYVEHRTAKPITPLHLFRSTVFSLATAQFFLAALVLFAGMLYVPMFIQTVQHKSAFVAGLYDIPLLLGLVAAAAISGPLITRTGRYKLYPVTGSVLVTLSMLALSHADQDTRPLAMIVPLAVAGAGIGFFVQVCLLAGQNAVGYEDLGTATGVLNFFRTLGGAFGAALFGTILAAGLRSPRPTAAESVTAFQAVFFWTTPSMALALVLALVTQEKPLSEATAASARS